MIPVNCVVPLFVPANRPERFRKAANSGADAIILDLEDAVPVPLKDEARNALTTDFTDLPVFVRINGEGTSWHQADIAAVSRLSRLAGVIVPKAELDGNLATMARASNVPVLALIETARGLAQARMIAELPNVNRLIFGSVDFCADLGCFHTREALLSARSELVLASRLANLPAPIDGITMSINDAKITTSDARYSFELGFGGKLAIHPHQIEAIHSGFRPQPSEIEWARNALGSDSGAAAVGGAMVDEPVRISARFILARAKKDP